MPGGRSWETLPTDVEFTRLFRLGIKDCRGGDGVPKEGSEPLTPICAALLHYTVTPDAYMNLGVNAKGKPVPGFLGIAANISALCTVTDGLRTGEVTCRVVYPKLKKDIESTPCVQNMVFVCKRFGANTIYAFLKRFPEFHPSYLFYEMITNSTSYTLFLTAKTKPGRRRFS